MATYQDVIIFSLLGGVVSLVGGVLLLSQAKMAGKIADYATPFAAGALLSAVFLDLLPEGIEVAPAENVFLAALVGMVLFFFAERFLIWFHHHHSHDSDKDRGASLIIIGDTLHNAMDGVAIAAGFLISVPTGIVTTLAVATHEIPQEVGDFGLLLNKGMSKSKIILANLLSALATLVAALIVFSLGSSDSLPLGSLLGLSAGFLLYIASSDVIPEIHQNAAKRKFIDWQAIMFLVGVAAVAGVISLAHS